MSEYLILSDIHGNVSAFEAVLRECSEEHFSGIVILGDCIDYGMRSNEIIKKIIDLENGEWKDRIMVNLCGNHEKIVMDKDYENLSSERGRVISRYTAAHLNEVSAKYISSAMNKEGKQEFLIEGMRCLAIHGSLENRFWKAIEPDNLRGDYGEYDLVFSGHSHYSHCFSHFYPIEDEKLRNKKTVVFINPGSVGQPRNQNPYAQYAVLRLPSKRIELRAVEYDISYEQSLYPDEVDAFYKNRLKNGV